jgi:2-haloacid dehalogenase
MTYVSPSTGCEIKAVLFDTFGSVVDWRSGVARDVAAFAKHHRIGVDAVAFADAWRAKYEPSMEPIRNRSREFVPLDQLHMENLHATIAEIDLNAADFDNRDIAVQRQPRPAAADGATGETALDRDRRMKGDEKRWNTYV